MQTPEKMRRLHPINRLEMNYEELLRINMNGCSGKPESEHTVIKVLGYRLPGDTAFMFANLINLHRKEECRLIKGSKIILTFVRSRWPCVYSIPALKGCDEKWDEVIFKGKVVEYWSPEIFVSACFRPAKKENFSTFAVKVKKWNGLWWCLQMLIYYLDWNLK